MARGAYIIDGYETSSKHARGPRRAEQAIAILPWAIDRVLGTRTPQERTRMLRRFLADGCLIATKGLRARVRAHGRDRWGGEPKLWAYLFPLPDIAYVEHRAERYRAERR